MTHKKQPAINSIQSEVNKGSRYHVPNLERALTILELLAARPMGLSLSEIVDELQLPKNSVFRITMTLFNHEYLKRDEDTKRFALTRKLLALGYGAVSEHNLVEKSLDVMRDLRDITKETVCLGTILDDEGVVLEQAAGLHPFKFLLDVGARFPIHTSAPTKAILANLSETEQDKMIKRINFTRYNERTIVDKDDFQHILHDIKNCGFGLDRGEYIEGARCVAAPIFDQHSYPVASIWITGPSERIQEEKYVELGEIVKKHAERISHRLGYGLL
jgi:DNA-binding IclR family transcriptional regulator